MTIKEIENYINQIWNKKKIKEVRIKIVGKDEDEIIDEIQQKFKDEIEENPNNLVILLTILKYAMFYKRKYVNIVSINGYIYLNNFKKGE
jgi:hypothetical protein